MKKYIYQYESWPHFTWDNAKIVPLLGRVRNLQGRVSGRLDALGFSLQEDTTLATITSDVLKSAEIEGEKLNYDQVRSSIARRLGIKTAGLVSVDRHIEGVVEMMLDATQRYALPLTEERLYGWHAALFPTGWSGMSRIAVGQYRTQKMQIVSGAIGKEKVHYEAPPPEDVPGEMHGFLDWLNEEGQMDDVLASGVAHLWFVMIHPFDDGNGRIARAISDMFLARSDDSPKRYYSLSSQILIERKTYYEVLNHTQYAEGDITEWLEWFLNCLHRALEASAAALEDVLRKADFWHRIEDIPINERQRKMLVKLTGDFKGKLRTSSWSKIAKCSLDTALNDINDLIEKGLLIKSKEGGRSTSYELVGFTDETDGEY
jgi:Fic family protein